MGRPKGSKNRTKEPEETPKTTRQSTSIASSSSASSSSSSTCNSVAIGTIIHDEQTHVPLLLPDGFRGKPFRGRGSRGGRGSKSNNIVIPASIPLIVPTRGKGRGKGRGNYSISTSSSSSFPCTNEQQSALNFPIQEPRSRVQKKDVNKLINSNLILPPVTELMSRTRTSQLLHDNEEGANNNNVGMPEYRVPFTTATIPSSLNDSNSTFTMPLFESQSLQSGGSNSNVINNNNNKGRGRGGVRGKTRGAANKRGSKKIGGSIPNLILDQQQQLSPVMNMTTTTTTLPTYDMAICTTTTFSSTTTPSSSIVNIPSVSYDPARTSPDQIYSVPSTSQMVKHETNRSNTPPGFQLPWDPSNIREKTLPIIKKGGAPVPTVSTSSSNNNNLEQTSNNNEMKNELMNQLNPNTTTTNTSTIPIVSLQPPPYDSSFANNQYQQQQFQQQNFQQTLPLPRLEVGDFNFNCNSNQVIKQPPVFNPIVNETVFSSNTFNMNLMYNDEKSDAIYDQIVGNRIYQPLSQQQQQQQQPSNSYPALSQQQMDILHMSVQQNLQQQLNPGHQIIPQESSILHQSLQPQQHFNDYSNSQIQQNNYNPTQQTSSYQKPMVIDGQGQNTSINFTPFTSSFDIPKITTTTNSSSTTTNNCDIPSVTAISQSNPYTSHMKSEFEQKQQQQFFSNFPAHQNTIAHNNNNNENTFDDRGSPSPYYMANLATPSTSHSSSFGVTKEQEPRDLEENYVGSTNNEQVNYSTYNTSTHQTKNDLSESSPRCPNYASDNNNMSRDNGGSSIEYHNRRIQSSSASSSSSSSSTTMVIQETTNSGIGVPINLPKTIHNVEGVVICHSPNEANEDSDTITDSSLENNERRGAHHFDSDLEIDHDEIADTIEIGQENISTSTIETVVTEPENSYTTESEHENISINRMEVENTEQEIMISKRKEIKKVSPPPPPSAPLIRSKNIKGKVKGGNKNKKRKENCSTSSVKKQQHDTEVETPAKQQQQQVESTELMNNKEIETQGYDSITSLEVKQQESMDVIEKESFDETVEDSQENNTSGTTITPNDLQQTVMMSEERESTLKTAERADLSQTIQNDESKTDTADQEQQQQTGGNPKDSFRTAYRKTKDGLTPYRLSANANKPQQALGRYRWMYNSEHKAFLYQDGKFVIERQDTFTTDDIFVWRIVKKGIEGRPCLRKFVPIQIDGRECHTGTDTFVPIRFDDYFYNNYQPVIFRMLADTQDLQIGMLYRIDRSLPECIFKHDTLRVFLLGYLPTTKHLFPDFKKFLMELTKMAIKGDYKEETTCPPIEKVADNPNAIENYLKKMIDAIIAEPKWPSETLICVITYPKLNTSKSGVVKGAGCQACGSVNKKAIGAFKLLFTGPPYDLCTLQLHDEKDPTLPTHPDYQFCHACPVTLRTLHRMMHYKWWTCVAIRAQIMDLCNQLKENEQFRAGDILEYFMGDFEWVEKMFLDFQILAIEGAHAINKAQKQEKFQQKRSSIRPVKASQADQEYKIKSTLPSKTTQQDPEKQEQLQLSTMTKKSDELLPPVPSLHTLQKVLQNYPPLPPPPQRTFLPELKKIKRRKQQKPQQPKARVVKPRRKAGVPKLNIPSQISEEIQSPVGNSRPKRKNNNSSMTARRKSLDPPPPIQWIPDHALQQMVKNIESESAGTSSSMNETRVQVVQADKSDQEIMKEEEMEQTDMPDTNNIQ